MRLSKRIAVTLALLASIGCSYAIAETKPYLEQRVEDLEKQVQDLGTRLKRLEGTPAATTGDARPREAMQNGSDAVSPPPQPRQWKSVRRGMSPMAVSQLLGEPSSRSGDKSGERWTYADGGFVDFDSVPEVTGLKVPD
jgi:hypothetical protein